MPMKSTLRSGEIVSNSDEGGGGGAACLRRLDVVRAGVEARGELLRDRLEVRDEADFPVERVDFFFVGVFERVMGMAK